MGLSHAAAIDISTVSTMVRVPGLHALTIGATAQSPLNAKLAATA